MKRLWCLIVLALVVIGYLTFRVVQIRQSVPEAACETPATLPACSETIWQQVYTAPYVWEEPDCELQVQETVNIDEGIADWGVRVEDEAAVVWQWKVATAGRYRLTGQCSSGLLLVAPSFGEQAYWSRTCSSQSEAFEVYLPMKSGQVFVDFNAEQPSEGSNPYVRFSFSRESN